MIDREPRQDRTGDDNDVLTAGLGALAWLDRFAEAAERPGPSSVDDDWVTAALGLISLRRSLRRWALQAEPTASSPTPESRPLEGLMR
jgi:hypothetical protein